MYTAQTLETLYRQHCEQSLDERETILRAEKLFPYTWRAIYSLMNQTLKEKERQNDHS